MVEKEILDKEDIDVDSKKKGKRSVKKKVQKKKSGKVGDVPNKKGMKGEEGRRGGGEEETASLTEGERIDGEEDFGGKSDDSVSQDVKGEESDRFDESEEDSVSATYLLIGVAGLVVLFFVFFFVGKAIMPSPAESETSYNGFSFVEQAPFWMTQVQIGNQRSTIPFYFHPKDLEEINYEAGSALKILELPPEGRVFITLDPDDATAKVAIAGVEISKIIGTKNNLLNIETHSATTESREDIAGYPVKTCADANDFTAIVYLKKGDWTLISTEGNCIIVEARNDEDLLKAADRLTYGLLGIMEP